MSKRVRLPDAMTHEVVMKVIQEWPECLIAWDVNGDCLFIGADGDIVAALLPDVPLGPVEPAKFPDGPHTRIRRVSPTDLTRSIIPQLTTKDATVIRVQRIQKDKRR